MDSINTLPVSKTIWLTELGFKLTDQTLIYNQYEDEAQNLIIHTPGTDEYFITRSSGDVAFEGRIPDQEFAKELFKNLGLRK